MQVIFTEDGIPSWFGPEPVAGSEPLDLKDLRPFLPAGTPEDGIDTVLRDILITHCRMDGRWLLRPAATATESKYAAVQEADTVEGQVPEADAPAPET